MDTITMDYFELQTIDLQLCIPHICIITQVVLGNSIQIGPYNSTKVRYAKMKLWAFSLLRQLVLYIIFNTCVDIKDHVHFYQTMAFQNLSFYIS